MEPVIDVVIPTYRPDARLLQIFDMLERQTLRVRAIRIINTEQPLFEKLLEEQGLDEKALAEKFPEVSVRHIDKVSFDHGGTRNLGVSLCTGADFCLLMTQDALPSGEDLVEKLYAPMEKDETLAVSYARQLPNPGERKAEVFSRAFNYPEESRVKSEEDFATLGIKTYFCSNVCALYRKSVLDALGDFPSPMIFNEDMVFAGRALKAGYRIRYTAEALVYHSHHYSAGQQFHRNFDLGVSQAMHPEIFAKASSEGEGMHYVKAVISYLQKNGGRSEIPGFVATCGARLAGYRLGKKYKKLPKRLVFSFTSNPTFFKAHPEVFLDSFTENS